VACGAIDDNNYYYYYYDNNNNNNNNNKNKLNQLTHELYRAEHFSTGHQLRSHSIVSQHFMEPEGSLQHLQEPSTCPFPEPDQSSQKYFTVSL
jgi:hypothetical protein